MKTLLMWVLFEVENWEETKQPLLLYCFFAFLIVQSFDSLIKEKDLELQHLENTLKNLQRSKQDLEDNLNRSISAGEGLYH